MRYIFYKCASHIRTQTLEVAANHEITTRNLEARLCVCHLLVKQSSILAFLSKPFSSKAFQTILLNQRLVLLAMNKDPGYPSNRIGSVPELSLHLRFTLSKVARGTYLVSSGCKART